MQNSTPSDLINSEIAFKPISFASPPEDEDVYRCVESVSQPSSSMADSFGLDLDLQSLSFVPSKLGSSLKQNGTSSSSLLVPSSQQGKSSLAPLEISFTEVSLSASTAMTPRSLVVPMKVNESSSVIDDCCNHLNSCLVELDRSSTMTALSNYLLTQEDTDFHADAEETRVDGLSFLSNHSVFFLVYLHEVNPSQTRVEFRRSGGDALAAAKLWADLRRQLGRSGSTEQKQECDESDDAAETSNFISLDLDCSGLPPLDLELPESSSSSSAISSTERFSKQEVDRITLGLIDNDCFLVDDLLFLYEDLQQHEKKCLSLLSDAPFMRQFVNHSMLNQDDCVLRLVLLILEKLARVNGAAMINMPKLRLLENAATILGERRPLLQGHCVRLLHALFSQGATTITACERTRQQLLRSLVKLEAQPTLSKLGQEIAAIEHHLKH